MEQIKKTYIKIFRNFQIDYGWTEIVKLIFVYSLIKL